MHKRSHETKALKMNKHRLKKVGCCSIYDIIGDKKGLSRIEKINYIRHHYSYYDGNYDLFFDAEEKPLELRKKLISLIEGIVDKKISPEALTIFNKQIMQLRKDMHNKVEQDKANVNKQFALELKQAKTRDDLLNACNYKIRKFKKRKNDSGKWLMKAIEANASPECIKMIRFYLDRHEILPFRINLIGYTNLINTVKLWLFNHSTYAKQFPEFYKEYSYMFKNQYANDNNVKNLN